MGWQMEQLQEAPGLLHDDWDGTSTQLVRSSTIAFVFLLLPQVPRPPHHALSRSSCHLSCNSCSRMAPLFVLQQAGVDGARVCGLLPVQVVKNTVNVMAGNAAALAILSWVVRSCASLSKLSEERGVT